MRALKALVIGMGVLIVAGIVVLVIAAVDRMGGSDGDNAGGNGLSGGVTSGFTPRPLVLPAGSEVVETRLSDRRILLRLRLGDGSGRLVILDAATGSTLGTVDILNR